MAQTVSLSGLVTYFEAVAALMTDTPTVYYGFASEANRPTRDFPNISFLPGSPDSSIPQSDLMKGRAFETHNLTFKASKLYTLTDQITSEPVEQYDDCMALLYEFIKIGFTPATAKVYHLVQNYDAPVFKYQMQGNQLCVEVAMSLRVRVLAAINEYSTYTPETPPTPSEWATEAYVDDAVSDEAVLRASADTTLQANIDSEASTRAAAITSEANSRASADTTLQTNITSEASTRASADTTLQANITAEQTARIANDAATLASAQSYADGLVVGLLDDRGNYDASVNTFPASGGSGTAGAVMKGDLWTISVAGTLGGNAVTAGDVVRALTNTPGQTSSNWAISENNIGYVAENSANKDTDGTLAANSDTKYPSQKATKTYADTKTTLAAVLAQKLSAFAATTSAELASVISDETGSGALVFGTSPTLSNPIVGTQSIADNSTKAASTAYIDRRFADAVITSNHTTTSSTLGNVTGLSFSIGANENWSFEIHGRMACSTANGLHFAITSPSGATQDVHVIANAGTQQAYRSQPMNTSGTATSNASCTTSGTDLYFDISGSIRNGANAGTVQLQIKSNTNGDTSTIYAGAYITARRIS